MRLLVVTGVFVARGPGVLVEPRLTLSNPPRGEFDVHLKFPSGEERTARAVLDIAHVRGPLPPYAMVRLLKVAAEDVPEGTEMFVDETLWTPA